MNAFKHYTLAAAAVCTLAAGAARADEVVRENRTVDARVTRVTVDGPLAVTIRHGAAPSLVIHADKKYIARITSVQNGDSLRIDADLDGLNIRLNKDNTIRAELTLPNLAELNSSGVGPSDVSGFAGEEIRLGLEGVGAVNFTGQYKRVNARLTGVGNMSLNTGNSDSVVVNHPGVGRVTLTGSARDMKATLSGMGSLEAGKLMADHVTLRMEGLGSATVYAKSSANLSLNGLGSVTAYGNPANRNVSVDGLGKVSWR